MKGLQSFCFLDLVANVTVNLYISRGSYTGFVQTKADLKAAT